MQTYYFGITGNGIVQSVILNGTNCNASEIYNPTSQTCVVPQSLLPQQGHNISLSPIWTFTVEGNQTLLPTVLTIFTTRNDTLLCVSYDSAPTMTNCFYTFTIQYPRSGQWYIFVPNNVSTFTNLTYHVATCPTDKAGDLRCETPVTTGVSTQLTQPTVKANSWSYFSYAADYPSSPFWVVVSDPSLNVYVSLNQIPTSQTYDLNGCNQAFCNSTTSINLNQTALTGSNLFYVGIYNPSTTDKPFYIWFNNTCPPTCAGHGRCNENGTNMGLCDCTSDWTGYGCATAVDNTLPAQYIVLIIIASLVVASAIIGFIAWAYMQKKHAGYVKVGG